MKTTLTVIIPCLNEEANLQDTYQQVTQAMGTKFSDYELIIINDGSTDKTKDILEELARKDPHVKAVHHPENKGFGFSYREGVSLASKEHIALIPGDNEIVGASIARVFDLVGKADIVIPFIMNYEVRPFSRRFLSRLFTLLMNTAFGCEIQYYNGPVIHKTHRLQSVPIRTSGFAFQATLLVRLILTGHSFIECEIYIRPRNGGRSTALKLKNIVSVLWTVSKLFFEVRLFRKEKYSGPIHRKLFADVPKDSGLEAPSAIVTDSKTHQSETSAELTTT